MKIWMHTVNLDTGYAHTAIKEAKSREELRDKLRAKRKAERIETGRWPAIVHEIGGEAS